VTHSSGSSNADPTPSQVSREADFDFTGTPVNEPPVRDLTTVFALYLNVFVPVGQIFLKIPAANALAPTQSEPPFAIAQTLVLAAFIYMGYLALKRFRPIAAGA